MWIVIAVYVSVNFSCFIQCFYLHFRPKKNTGEFPTRRFFPLSKYGSLSIRFWWFLAKHSDYRVMQADSVRTPCLVDILSSTAPSCAPRLLRAERASSEEGASARPATAKAAGRVLPSRRTPLHGSA